MKDSKSSGPADFEFQTGKIDVCFSKILTHTTIGLIEKGVLFPIYLIWKSVEYVDDYQGMI